MGKYAQQHYEGPQLDFSAFSDLVNHHQYKSVLQLSPSASTSRSEDSDSTASSHQGSPRPPAKRTLTLQSVQEDFIEPDETEDAAVTCTGSPREEDTNLDVPTQRSNQPFLHRNNIAELNLSHQVEDLDKFQRENETAKVFNGQNLDSGDFIKPPSPFAEVEGYHHANTSSPIYENQSSYLPTTSTNQEYLYGHKRQPSGDSVGYSSAHGSCYSAESKTPSQSEFLNSPHHVRDNSYDSLLSEDRTASLLNDDSKLHEEGKKGFKQGNSAETMPTRYDVEDNRTNMDASEGKTNANIRYSATFDAVYDQDNRLNSSGMNFLRIYLLRLLFRSMKIHFLFVQKRAKYCSAKFVLKKVRVVNSGYIWLLLHLLNIMARTFLHLIY